MEQDLDKLLDKMSKGLLSEEETKLIEDKAQRLANLHQLAEARNEWREGLRKFFDARAAEEAGKKTDGN